MKKKRFFAVGIISSLVIVFALASFVAYDYYSGKRYSKQSAEIADKFSSWCSSKRYVYYDLDTGYLEFGPKEKIKNIEAIIKVTYPNIDSFFKSNSFLYKNDHLYFSGSEKTNAFGEQYCIYKANKCFSHVERIEAIKITENNSPIKCTYGFNNKGYFSINNQYIVFDFENETKQIVEYLDENCFFNGIDKYMNYLGINRSKCKTKKNGIYEFYYNDKLNVFDENYIETSYLDAMKKYGFKISWQISFPSGLTTLVYCGNRAWFSDCVLVSYNRNTHTIIDYQLLTGVSGNLELSYLYPDITLFDGISN